MHHFKSACVETVKGGLKKKCKYPPIKTVSNIAPLSSLTLKTSKITSNCHAIQASVKNCVILNKGNINATLQCLSTMMQFWLNFNTLSKTLSPFVPSFVEIMSLLKSSKSTIDPSQFLRFLKQVLLKSGKPHFNIFEQQDDGEYLARILDELCGDFMLALDLVQVKIRVTIDCSSCHQSIDSEDSFTIIQLPVGNNSAVFFRFIFNNRTFVFSVITVHFCNQPSLNLVFLESGNSS